ncbi:MAG: DUF1573 domain-containing protein [Bacteroidia bacterium]
MRIIFPAVILVAVCLSVASCDQKGDARVTTDMITNSQTATGENIAVSDITFDKDTFDFGTVIEGEKVAHAFTFTNTGQYDLIVSKAVGSCGCTVPEWPKEPIRPGKTGVIDVVFNSDRRVGKAMKDVTIYANTEPATRKVVLTGFVKGDPSEE